MKNLHSFKLSRQSIAWQQAFTLSFTLGLLTAASVAQASDLQIYAKPTAGKKTIIMMLDTSGSMGYTAGSSYSLTPDYNVCTNTSSITTGTLTNDRLYSVTSTTTPTYARNFCYIAASNASNYPKVIAVDGCEKQSDNSYRCYDRLTRLKDGMFKFLDTATNSELDTSRVGVGHYSAYGIGNTSGDGTSGEIMVAAKAMGPIGSAQRLALKTAVAGLVASNGTPTAHAYAEAAAYLMGTSTYSENYTYRDIAVERYRLIRRYTTQRTGTSSFNYRYKYTYTYNFYTCSALNSTNFSSYIQTCSNWGSASNSSYTDPTFAATSNNNPQWTNQPGIPTYDTFTASPSSPSSGSDQTLIFRKTESQLYQITADPNSGTPKSKSRDTLLNPDIVMNRAASNLDAVYKSPLPAVADRVTCDGQGVYILSDGAANSSSDSEAAAVMSKSLGSYGSGFSCSGGLTDTGDGGAWNCMGEYAKKLYSSTTNPAGVSIQTAFVGFGSAMSSLTTNYVQRACQLTSRTQIRRTSNDTCSPGLGDYAVASPGYGNGGFFTTQSSDGVTESVIDFIRGLGSVPLDPLPTGAPSIPVDALNPSGFQPFAYLRMLEPNPASSNLIWRGNLKKYNVFNGALTDGATASGTKVFNNVGEFTTTTKDIWNNSSYTDGGVIELGGAYSRVPMPAIGRDEDSTKTPIVRQVPKTPEALRALFTDVASSNGTTLTPIASPGTGASVNMLQVVNLTGKDKPAASVLAKFAAGTGQAVLRDFPLAVKLKLLNYLGYPVDLTLTALPSSLTPPVEPFLAMGGIIHSLPVQMTYSGTLKNEELDGVNTQSVLYGTMEGGLHLVDSVTGEEQMVFVPAELLNATASKALSKGETDAVAPVHGIDGAWVADPAYRVGDTYSKTEKDAFNQDVTNNYSDVTAKQMNVYGGLRMGGSSYYGLNLLTPTNPKLLFRVNASTSGLSRLGQTWSKPVLANVRYNGAIKRVMIVGGGYDTCYENPRFRLNASVSNTDYPDTTCNNKAQAQGNAVYMLDAKTGAVIWSATYDSAATDGKLYMTNSIVSRISTLDRDADGLVDHLYFGDLGGQVFRVDLNNVSQRTSGQTSKFGVRVVRLANLATTSAGAAITNGDNPRFYEAPTITIHDQKTATFILVGIASGDRSTPLDVSPSIGREGMRPLTAMTSRPVNNVYGILDRDFINQDLVNVSPATTVAYSSLQSKNLTLASFQKNPQLLTDVVAAFFPYAAGTSKEGWYRSLSSTADGTEKAGVIRTAGGMKAFEEPVAITGNLLVPVYDPEGTGVAAGDPCLPRVVGETDRQQYCLPYGACFNKDGARDSAKDAKTGFLLKNNSNHPDSVLGSGIRGIALGPKIPDTNTSPNSCGNLTLVGNTEGTGTWTCTKKLLSTRWYEKYLR